MRFDAELRNFITPEEFEKKFGLQTSGPVQRAIDAAVIRYTDPYVPYKTGALARSVNTNTVLGSGAIVYNTPYAARMYYNPQYHFNTEKHPQAGGYWFERAMADHKNDVLKEAKRAVNNS